MGSIGETSVLEIQSPHDLIKGSWCQILSLDDEDVEPDSNFFALGGDSIDALKVARLVQQAGIALNVNLMLRHPQFSEMVRAVLEQSLLEVKQIERSDDAVPTRFIQIPESSQHEVLSSAVQQCHISESEIVRLFPCTPMQMGLVVLTAQQHDLYWAQQSFKLPSDWPVTQVEAAWKRVVEANEALRSRIIQMSDGTCYQVVLHSENGTMNKEVKDGSSNPPFGQPLFYCWIEPGRLQWRVHHAVYDAWSQRLIFNALVDAYQDPTNPEVIHPPFSSFAGHLAQMDLSQSMGFWCQHLHGYEGQAFPRALTTDEPRDQAHVSMNFEWSQSQHHLGFTAATAIQTAWGIVLARYNEVSDVVFGVVSMGRSVAIEGEDVARIIGPMIATIPYSQYGDCLPHEHLGLAHISSLGDSGPAQASRFQSLLVIQPDEVDDSPIHEILAERRDDYMEYPLSLECFLGSNSIRHPSNQTSLVSQLNMWTATDTKIMQQWHSTPIDLIEECIHTLIEQRSVMGKWEDSPAVCGWDGEFSYSQLLLVSKQLAQRLRAAGVGPEILVPIAHEKSCWTLISILGVLQAGGAFVLLDSGLPVARMQTMISVVEAPLIICSEALQAKVSGLANQILCLDSLMQKELLQEQSTNHRDASFSSGVAVDNAAYAVFTSGTTGVPKAVVAEHRQVATAFHAQAMQGMFQRNRRMLQVATYSFDPSIADMLGPLFVGGVALSLGAEFEGVATGGEAVTAAQLKRWTKIPHFQFHNSYGPSECCVTAALTPPLHSSVNPLNFGSPSVGGTGLVGELAIQGPIVTRGYLNNADSQKRAFVEISPYETFSEDMPPWASRIYLTGDLARFAPDGSVIFVGRKDHQVKLNGQRIELGEIEATATKIEGLEEAVVMIIKSNSRAELVLVAQWKKDLISQSEGIQDGKISRINSLQEMKILNLPDVSAVILRQLSVMLPPFMVPAVCLLTDCLPLSLTGKTDRKGLQHWIEQQDLSPWRKSIATATIPASDTVARQLSELLEPLLPDGSIEDPQNPPDFAPVSAGLDSIRMVSFVRAINRTFGILLPLSRIPRTMLLTELAITVKELQFRKDTNKEEMMEIEDIEPMLRDLQRGVSCHFASGPTPSSAIQNVFLTGATGYVGTAILQRLLYTSSLQRAYLLVRADDAATGLERVRAAAIKAGWWDETLHSSKIKVWVGDLSKPKLGLNSSQWEQLRGCNTPTNDSQITGIIHNGALVHWQYSYSELRAANVDSTTQLVSIVTQNPHIARLEYISGGAQWDPSEEDSVFSTSTLQQKLHETNGYGQSKLIAEQVVAATAALQKPEEISGSRLGILNPALIIGGPSHGHAANLDDLIWRLISACVLVGEYYPEPEEWIYISRAEDVAQMTVDALINPTVTRKQRKMLNGIRVRIFWEAVNAALDTPLQASQSYSVWLGKLNESLSEFGDEHPCWPVINVIETMGPGLLSSPTPAWTEANDWEEMERVMAHAVALNVKYLQDLGYLGRTWSGKDFPGGFRRRG
ncbi:nonribosomal peptide [Botrytis cinerea]